MSGHKTATSFRVWLRKQRKRDDRVGDFARDFLDDDCGKGLTTRPKILDHLRDTHGVVDKVLDSFEQAWSEFQRAQVLPLLGAEAAE